MRLLIKNCCENVTISYYYHDLRDLKKLSYVKLQWKNTYCYHNNSQSVWGTRPRSCSARKGRAYCSDFSSAFGIGGTCLDASEQQNYFGRLTIVVFTAQRQDYRFISEPSKTSLFFLLFLKNGCQGQTGMPGWNDSSIKCWWLDT